MTKHEFNSLLKSVSTKKLLDKAKVSNLPDEVKIKCIEFLVRNRHAIIVEFFPKDYNYSWIHSCGYLYKKSNKHFTFICTSEHNI